MDPAAQSSHSPPPRAPSSEPGSTRPNPFDDTDAASRKRRRTSGSGDSVAEMRDKSSPVHITSTEEAVASEQSMTMDDPQTPTETSNGSPQDAGPPSSSKVTINLRKTNSSDDKDASPPPLLEQSGSGARGQSTPDNVGDLDVDLIEEHREEYITPPTGSSSPPVELVEDRDDDDLEMQSTIEDIRVGGLNAQAQDPILDFPYKDPSEHPCEVVERLVAYLAGPQAEPHILTNVNDWLFRYVHHIESKGREQRLESFRTHGDFLKVLSKTPTSMLNHRPPLHHIPQFRDVVVDYYANLMRLTKHLIDRDLIMAKGSEMALIADQKTQPQLLSPPFLEQFGALIQSETDDAEVDDMGVDQHHEFADQLNYTFGEGSPQVCELMESLVELLPTFPALLDSLSSGAASLISSVRSATLRFNSPAGRDCAAKYLTRIHRLWPAMDDCLHTLIDKNVTQIDKIYVSQLIERLACLLNLRVKYSEDNNATLDRVRKFKNTYPQLPKHWVPDAMCLEWKFDILSKLIRCSQMQLRVMAASSMCQTLVSLWKRFEEDPTQPVLRHMADYLKRGSIIEYILGANSHPAIINESANIVGFLAVTRTYEERHTDQLWRAFSSSQDPRAADALVRLIVGVTNLLDMSSLGDLCAKLDNRPFIEFTPPMRSLFDSIMKRMLEKSSIDEPLTYQPYALCLRLLRESTLLAQKAGTAPPEMHQVLMHRLRDLIRASPEKHREELYQSCLLDISQKSDTTLGSLWCLSLTVSVQSAIGVEMELLTWEHDFARLLVEEIEHAVTSHAASNTGPVLCGQVNKPRMDFLIQILRHQPSSIDDGLGDKLWNVMVGSLCCCIEDREVGWRILNDIRGDTKNPYIRSCYSIYLPKLPTEDFCEGTLKFIREELLYLLKQTEELHLDDETSLRSSCLEQLWRLVLEVPDQVLAARAIHILAREVYIDNSVVTSYPPIRARQVHSAFVARCLAHLRESATCIKGPQDAEVMVVEGSEEKQERIFTRSLQLLTYFLGAHQNNARFSAPDLRPFMSRTPSEIAGELAQLKYQSFDGVEQTDVKPLQIGKLNTAASLLASIRQETGFPNYRAYYRGQPFLLSERDICRSLEDLQIRDGLILVKREEEGRTGSFKHKPGLSPLQAEIMSHFPEMAGYLDLKENLAAEVYEFLCRLPADITIIEAFEDASKSHADVFPPAHPYRSLYAAHALFEYKDMAVTSAMSSSDPKTIGKESFESTRRRIISLLVRAIQDDALVPLEGSRLELEFVATLLRSLFVWSSDRAATQQPVSDTEFGIQSPEKFIAILEKASTSEEKHAESVTLQMFPVLLMLGHHDLRLWDSIQTNSTFRQICSTLILRDSRPALRIRVTKFVQNFSETGSLVGHAPSLEARRRNSDAQIAISQWFWELCVHLLPEAMSFRSQCSELMNLLLFLTNSLASVKRDALDLHAVAKTASGLLLSHETTEDIDQAVPFDAIPRGLTLVLLKCLQNDEGAVQSPILRPGIVYDLFWRHLFPLTRAGHDQNVSRVVLNSETRWKICEVLLFLSKDSREHYVALLQCLNEVLPFFINDEDDQHYLYSISCNFDRAKALRASCGYAGLRNLSNTCYLNSLLTQLYMNTGFRSFIMQASLDRANEKQTLLKETKKVFGFLQESYHRFVDPEDFVSAIQQYDGTPIDIHNQMDVDEFYNLLFDRLEAQLPDGDSKKEFREFYGGQLVQQIKSKECNHISERLESFSAIQLDIKGKRCLEESLQTYIEGEVLEGDNKYKCSTCDSHVDAVKRACLKDLPDNVIFHLKRFDFNLFTLQRSKINDYFSFPEEIDLNPYTVEHLSDPSSGKEDMFELVGVLIHAGTSESGHYYSYIRERPSKTDKPRWFEFNDDVVSEWDPANLEASAFGGPEHRPAFDNGIIYDKSYSAYMLFYERASKLRQQEQQAALSGTPIPVCVSMEPQRRSHIRDENTQLLRRHCLFDPSHLKLVKEAFELLPRLQAAAVSDDPSPTPETNADVQMDSEHKSVDFTMRGASDSPQSSTPTAASEGSGNADTNQPSTLMARNGAAETLQDLAMEVALSHIDQVVSRKKDIPDFATFMEMLDRAVSGSPEAAHSYYRYFYLRPAAFRALLQRNAEPLVRQNVGKQFLVVLRKIAADTPQHYTGAHALPQRPIGVPVMGGVMHILKYLWQFFHVSIRAWDEYFSFILGFAQMGDTEIAHLLAEDYVFKLCSVIATDRRIELPQQYMRLLNFVERRSHGNRPPSYRELLFLLNHLLVRLDPDIDAGAVVDSATDRLTQHTPFSWSTQEAQFIMQNLEGKDHSFFMEKLLTLDEKQRSVHPVAVRLIQAHEFLDRSAAAVLMRNIFPNASSKSLEADLQLTSYYLTVTRCPVDAEGLISHVATLAKEFDSEDMPALIDFFQTALTLRRRDHDLAAQFRKHALSMTPDWAPIMLVQPSSARRKEVMQMLDDHLFDPALVEFAADNDFGEDSDAQRQLEDVMDIARRLGINCLLFLRDVHVMGANAIGRGAADTITAVIKKCRRFFDEDPDELPDRMHRDFLNLQDEISEPLRQLIVDIVDDDGTDWEVSSPRSDQMDGITADMNLQIMNEFNDTNDN